MIGFEDAHLPDGFAAAFTGQGINMLGDVVRVASSG